MKMKLISPKNGWAFMVAALLSVAFLSTKEVVPNVKGTWVLQSSKHGDSGKFVDVPKEVSKKKIVTASHFTWYEYDKTGNLIALGGGTYRLEGNTYTEEIEYFYPAGSSLLGMSIPFNCKMEGNNKWIHSGFLQEREIDSSTGFYVVTKTEKLEEIWVRDQSK